MEEHDRIADERLEEADRLQEPSKDLEREIENTREDWEKKQKQEAVPGAVDPDKFRTDEDEGEELPEPEYEELNPQSADATGGGRDESDSGSDDE